MLSLTNETVKGRDSCLIAWKAYWCVHHQTDVLFAASWATRAQVAHQCALHACLIDMKVWDVTAEQHCFNRHSGDAKLVYVRLHLVLAARYCWLLKSYPEVLMSPCSCMILNMVGYKQGTPRAASRPNEKQLQCART